MSLGHTLALSKSVLFGALGHFTGIKQIKNLSELNKVSPDAHFIAPRSIIEKDVNWVHPVPYVVLVDEESNAALSYRRGAKSGEKRLVGAKSIGFGGHIDPEECFDDKMRLLSDCVKAAMMRELEEEIGVHSYENEPTDEDDLGISFSCSTPEGMLALDLADYETFLIYDNTTEVGAQHLGVAVVLYFTNLRYARAIGGIKDEEGSVGDVAFCDLDDNLDEFENWSKLVVSTINSVSNHEIRETLLGAGYKIKDDTDDLRSYVYQGVRRINKLMRKKTV